MAEANVLWSFSALNHTDLVGSDSTRALLIAGGPELNHRLARGHENDAVARELRFHFGRWRLLPAMFVEEDTDDPDRPHLIVQRQFEDQEDVGLALQPGKYPDMRKRLHLRLSRMDRQFGDSVQIAA